MNVNIDGEWNWNCSESKDPFSLAPVERKSIKHLFHFTFPFLIVLLPILLLFPLAIKLALRVVCNPIDCWNMYRLSSSSVVSPYLSSTQVPHCMYIRKYVPMSFRLPLASGHSCAHINWLYSIRFTFRLYLSQEYLSTHCEYESECDCECMLSRCKCGILNLWVHIQFFFERNLSGNPLWSTNVEH